MLLLLHLWVLLVVTVFFRVASALRDNATREIRSVKMEDPQGSLMIDRRERFFLSSIASLACWYHRQSY